jgi:hypothetical protein
MLGVNIYCYTYTHVFTLFMASSRRFGGTLDLCDKTDTGARLALAIPGSNTCFELIDWF